MIKHVGSVSLALIAGLVSILVVFFARHAESRSTAATPAMVQFAPDPDRLFNFVQDRRQPPFVVPPGFDLVLTDSFGGGSLVVNGVIVAYAGGLFGPDPTCDPGLVMHAGDSVDIAISGSSSAAGLAGYFVDASVPPSIVRLPYVPDAREIVYVDSSIGTYTVPAGRHLVIRWTEGDVYVNGRVGWSDGNVSTLRSGVVASGGDVVTPTYAFGGYLRRD